ncbi:transmembrane protein 82-like [Nelusetta ayraudi]|uniref:transmembrane protein 82-like n=1 Tax=Nelusetta ayraudi TaxID=303726 RepID=UPI003F72047B
MCLFFWIFGSSEWSFFPSSPIENICQGLVGACGISVLCNLMRVYYFTQTCRESAEGSSSLLKSGWRTTFQFWSLAMLLSVVGSRVSSLIVLEFSLRAVSAWASAGLDGGGRGVDLLLLHCQFSLSCSLTVTLDFLHQGAPHSAFSLLLAAALSWALSTISHNLWRHVATFYPLHSTKHYCGKCITLLTSGHGVLASLQRAVVLAFAVGAVASIATVYNHFLSHKDALKFWTPLTLCYSLLVVYTQEDQNRQAVTEAQLHSVVLRLGALLVLMLTVGHWADVFHVLIAFLGEAVCLLPSQDLLKAALKEEEDTSVNTPKKRDRSSKISPVDSRLSN